MLVVEHKLISIEYFMNELQPWEIDNILSVLKYSDRTTWEQTRMLLYVTAQVNSTKQLKAQDLMKFDWDDENSLNNTNISNDDIVRLREKAKSMRDIIAK